MAKRTQLIKLVATSVALLTLTACGSSKSAESMAQTSLEVVGCKSFQSEMWNSLYKIAEEGTAFPSSSELRKALLAAGETKGMTGSKFERFVDAFVANYEVTIEGIKSKFAPEDPEAWKKALGEMEIGIRATDVHAELGDEIGASMAKMDAAQEALEASCEDEGDLGGGNGGTDGDGSLGDVDGGGDDSGIGQKFANVWEQIKSTQGLETYGMRKTIATAYQSCDVLGLKEMTASTPSVEGIKITGTHSSGGKKREIASLPQLLGSHYYYKGVNLAKSSCFEVRKSPMIYDFGGKPATSSSNPYHLNMFKNGGSGTSVLGIDCSGLVFSALGVAGLKLDPDPKKVMKATLVGSVGSGAFKEPQSNGLRCLAKIAMSKSTSILPGDIIAINGHVVMVDAIGADPLGLKNITSSSGCTSANISSSKMDFVIAQSSPVKGGIGIDRHSFKDYAAGSSTFKKGVEAYALAACKAKFGGDGKVSYSSLSIVRHKKTAECKTAKALTHENESCVDSCRAL